MVSYGRGNVIPFSFDLSVLVRRSVATLYSNLVTRPTGRALRLGIESQIGELGSCCLSVLDFTQVVVLDYSCADEAVAKLVLRYLHADRPADVYFVARGLGEQHRDPIDEVLRRHGLGLVAEIGDAGYTLLGHVSVAEKRAWAALELAGSGTTAEIADRLASATSIVATALDQLVERRLALHGGDAAAPQTYIALTSLLPTR
ncbi:MAG: hypothetical protein ACRELX_19320 [Longimicrobiales bacterium]